VTHSFCTLEFEIHRPLYDWVLQALEFHELRRCRTEVFAAQSEPTR
jgi:glutamyl/glutaminyl-tRNA synthetase